MVASVPILPGTERRLEPTTRWLRRTGQALSPRQAETAAAELGRRVLAWCSGADLLLTPTVAQPPPPVGAFRGLDGEGVFRAMAPIGAFTAPFNASGQPAVSVPAGTTRDGLPIGVQLVAPRGGDRLLIGVAAALEAALA
jgi:amidase